MGKLKRYLNNRNVGSMNLNLRPKMVKKEKRNE